MNVPEFFQKLEFINFEKLMLRGSIRYPILSSALGTPQ